MKHSKIQDYRWGINNQRYAQRRVDEGECAYGDPQPCLDGLSLASFDVEMADRRADLQNEFGLTDEQLQDIEDGRLMFYSIPEANLPLFQEQFDKLAHKAENLGAEPITLTVGESHDTLRQNPRTEQKYVVRYFEVEVRGEAPKFAGWTLAATLQRLEMEDGTEEGMLRCVPGTEAPRALAKRLGCCDHCHIKRMRNDTYVLRHVSGEYNLVGSSCLKDFLGHNSPHSLAQIAQYLIEIGELCEGAGREDYYGGGGGPSRWSPEMVLGFAAAVIRKDGFMSRKRVRESYDDRKRATADIVAALLYCKPKASKEDAELLEEYKPTEADTAMAEAAREWARGHAESQNDYLYNLSLIARSGSLEARNLGLAAAMVASYQRETTEQAVREAAPASEHFGKVKERGRFTLTFLGSTRVDNDWGFKTVCRFREGAGNLAGWFAAGAPGIDFAKGESYDVDATVKEHGEYNGRAQTILTRVSLHKEKVKARKSKKAIAQAA